eukprot:350208-Chlamydomonas_euryale.AAC.12
MSKKNRPTAAQAGQLLTLGRHAHPQLTFTIACSGHACQNVSIICCKSYTVKGKHVCHHDGPSNGPS